MKMTTRHTYVNVNGKVVHRIQAGGGAGGAIPATTPLPPQGTPLLAQRRALPQEAFERSSEHSAHSVLAMEGRDEPEDEPEESPISVGQVMRPLFISLKCYGLVLREREGRVVQVCTFYCVCVMCLLWFNALRYFAAYIQPDSHGTRLFMKIVIHIWNLQCALSVTVFILVSYKHVGHFIQLWQAYKNRYGGVPSEKLKGFACRVAMSINIMMLSFAVIGIALFSIKLPSLTSIFLTPFSVQGPVPVWAAAIYFTFHYYMAFCWIQPNIVLVIICVLLKKEFQEFSSNFRSTLVTPDSRGRPYCGGSSDIEGHRQRHLLLCKVTDTLDDMFSLFNLLTFLFDIPTICAFIFVLVKNEDLFAQDVLALTASIVFFVIALTHVVSVTVAGASLCAVVSIPLLLNISHLISHMILAYNFTNQSERMCVGYGLITLD